MHKSCSPMHVLRVLYSAFFFYSASFASTEELLTFNHCSNKNSRSYVNMYCEYRLNTVNISLLMFQKRYNVVLLMFTKAADSDRPKSIIKAQKNESWLLSVGFYHPAFKVFWSLMSFSLCSVEESIFRQSKQCVFLLLLTFSCHQQWNIPHLKPTAGTHHACEEVDWIHPRNALTTQSSKKQLC